MSRRRILKLINRWDYNLIDLGLPSGNLWVDRNLMAIDRSDVGLYYMWADTEGYASVEECGFFLEDYKYYDSNTGKYLKYNTTDKKVSIEDIDNAAKQIDNTLDIPTDTDWQELINYTTFDGSQTLNGKHGILLFSKTNNNTLWIPASGYLQTGELRNMDKCAESTVKNKVSSSSENLGYSYYLRYFMDSNKPTLSNGGSAYVGRPIRAICKKKS